MMFLSRAQVATIQEELIGFMAKNKTCQNHWFAFIINACCIQQGKKHEAFYLEDLYAGRSEDMSFETALQAINEKKQRFYDLCLNPKALLENLQILELELENPTIHDSMASRFMREEIREYLENHGFESDLLSQRVGSKLQILVAQPLNCFFDENNLNAQSKYLSKKTNNPSETVIFSR